MRIPRVRLGLRYLMLLVVAVAALCWLEVRRQRFRALADYHASRRAFSLSGNQWGMVGDDLYGRPITAWEDAWHRQLAEKYRRASRQPWQPVAPDPDQERFREEFRVDLLRRSEDGTLVVPLSAREEKPATRP